MTNCIKMTKSISASLSDGLSAKAAGNLSMISMLAISVGIAAAPAQAQEMAAPAMTAPVQAPPVIVPQPAPTASPTMAPTIAAPPASAPPSVKAEATPPVTPERADELASKGGFDAETVAPEALAQIEREQQERKAAAAKAAAASVKTPVRASGSASPSDGNRSLEPTVVAEMPTIPEAETEGATSTVAAIPTARPVPEIAASPDTISDETGADWGLLAALAALLGVGGAGAYAASRRRNSKGEAATAPQSNDSLPASLTAATIPDQHHDLVEEEIDPAADMEQVTARTLESKATTKADFAQFVADLPAFENTNGKAGRGVALGQRRVAAAPRPYLAEADLARTAGYFTANVDASPTPQNPFLTRQKRLKRARYLDGKLAGVNTPPRESRTRIAGKMQIARPLEPAFS